jgi:hypothetical protein
MSPDPARTADAGPRHGLNRLVAVLLAAAVVAVIVLGLRAMWQAQRGELRGGAAPAGRILAAPELPRERVRVHACRGAGGATVYSGTPCRTPAAAGAGDDGGHGGVEVTTVDLAPPRR